MFVKTVLSVSAMCLVVAAAPQAHRYPAGLNPSLCPGYPHCDNLLLAKYAGNGNAGAYDTGAYQEDNSGAYVHDNSGDYVQDYNGVNGNKVYPAGVDPSTCPNYPFCDNNIGSGYQAPPLPGFTQRLYPEGVSAYNCPNYPFCH